MGALPEAEVLVLGEVHDSPQHHVNQGEAIARMGARAVVFEMQTPDQAAGWRPGLAADPAALDAAIGWSGSGWPPLAEYLPIFEALGEAVVVGAAVPPEAMRAAMEEGAAAAFGPGAARFGLGEALGVEESAERIAEQAASHCGLLPEEMLPGMVEAQRLRDATLADAALAALEAHGAPVAVVTGNGHARTDRGVPALIARAAPGVAVHSLGQIEAPAEGAPFDSWLVTDAPPRDGDPCDALRPEAAR